MSINLYKTEQIRRIEQLAIASVCSASELMQRAGSALFKQLLLCWPKAHRIAVFVGGGNNGGDGYVLAALAKAKGLEVWVRHIGTLNNLPSPALGAMQACSSMGIEIKPYESTEICTADVIVDALLGIGLNADVNGEYALAIQTINDSSKPVLAVDIPSGIQADTGRICGTAVRADQTLTFIAFKQGLFTGQAPAYCGNLACAPLDLPIALFQDLPPAAQTLFLSHDDFQARKKDAHKGDFGHVLVVGGNKGMGGAARLAAEAAVRVGAGLVSLATRAEHVSAMIAACPEVMCHAVQTAADLEPLLNRATVVLLGPGLGQDDWAKDLYRVALFNSLPKVVDADALNLLAKNSIAQPCWILTPHPGEAGRLLNSSSSVVQADRFLAAKILQQNYEGVVVLKGAGTIVQGDEIPHVCLAGNPGMASGGMGDVLGGVIAGLLAQGFSLQKAADLGTLVHALAADKAAVTGERGLLAADLLQELKGVIN